MRALLVHHDYQSHPGPVGDALRDHGYELEEFLIVDKSRWTTPNVSVTFPEVAEFDLICLFGSPWSVYDPTIATWFDDEVAAIVEADAAGVPILGICFGAQALAVAFGGTVQRAAVPEIGWYEIESFDDATVAAGLWFEYHFDAITPPDGAVVLARSTSCVQAFRYRQHLGVQFHPEATPALLSMWLDEAGRAEIEAAGFDAHTLEAQTDRLAGLGATRTATLIAAFVEAASDATSK